MQRIALRLIVAAALAAAPTVLTAEPVREEAAAATGAAQYPDPPDTTPAPPPAPAPQPSPDAPKPGNAAAARPAEPAPIVAAIKQRIADRKLGLANDERAAVLAMYETRNGALWTDAGGGLSAAGKAILDELRRADDYGLPAQDIVPKDVLIEQRTSDEARPADLAEVELRMTAAVLDYASLARGNRIPEPSKQLATYIDRTPQRLKPSVVLDRVTSAADPADALRKLNPQHPQFEALRRAYVELRGKPSAAAQPRMSQGPSIRPGDRHPDVVTARTLIKAPVADGADPELYDKALVDLIRSFQEAQDLSPADGIIGRKTRAALNSLAEPEGPSARDLLVNMEQWRWMPDDLGETHIEVNIPEYMIRLKKGGETLFEERVVVGQVDKQTPLFSDRLQTIVLRPDWILPESVKVREAIPSLLGRGDFFYSYGLRIKKGETEVDPRAVDWAYADQRHYTFYQPPGDKNALGQVKFLFPNKHAVYFHDTPTKPLFDKRERAFSRGCIRVRDPVRLTTLLLQADRGWSGDNVRALIESGEDDNRVALGKPIPIHITYFTVTARADGRIERHKDVYGHAKRISLALDGRWGEIDIPPDHLAPIEDREFEWRVSAMERRREREQITRYRYYQPSPMDNFFKSIFGP